MMLRSRSTPLLSSLTSSVVPLHTSQILKEDILSLSVKVERERVSVESPRLAAPRLGRSVSLTSAALASAAASPLSQHVGVADDSGSLDGSEWDFCGDVVPWPRFRRAQSDGDLENLSRGMSALTAAAESLVTSPLRKGSREDGFDAEKRSSIQRQWSRRLSLRRQPSLSVIPSSSDSSGSESDDIQDAKLLVDEPRVVETDISRSQTDNGTENGFHHTGDEDFSGYLPEYSSLSVTNAQVVARNDVDSGPDGRLSQSRLAPSVGIGHPSNDTSVSGRENNIYYKTFDGERYSSVSTAANGNVLVCNSRGCKPVAQSDVFGPMFIAGGFGIGAGGGPGRNHNVATGGEGGRGDSLGTDAYYELALQANPGHPLLLRNYAKFLHEVKRDSRKAESYYERAILANPADGELLGLYAKLIWDEYKDEERAGRYFEQAVQSSPEDCYVVAAYASFLWALDAAEKTQDTAMDVGHSSGLGPGVASQYSSVTTV